MLCELRSKGINVEFIRTKKVFDYLEKSKIFLSLQKYSNYPSRALAEALVCGNIPIITDVGESRLMISKDLGRFIPVKFSCKDLLEAILEIFAYSFDEYKRRAIDIKTFADRQFSIKRISDYYIHLYDLL